MAEFLKNNPVALRHCLLYVFLQEKSTEKALDNFCKTVERGVIGKEDWFDQFEQVKLGGEKQSITDIREIIRNDKQALRVCVMYECLTAKDQQIVKIMKNSCLKNRPLPVFSKYQNFCKVIGDDVIEYREFEFWFYRFFNGDFDLNYERNKDKNIHELTNVPLDIIRRVLEYCDIGDRLSLERTSRSVRDFSRNQKVFHDNLAFEHGWDNNVDIIYGEKDTISYEQQGNDCVMEFRDRKTVLRGVSFLNQALQEFRKILENPKLYLNSLLIRVTYSDSSETYIKDTLKLSHLLHVKHLTVCAQSMKTFLNILSSMEPGYLTAISLNIDSRENIEEVVKTEQWKQAKYLNMHFSRFTAPLIHLYHFKKFKISYPKLTVKDIREMKEILFKSPDFEKCTLRLSTPLHMDTIGQEIGNPIQGRPNNYHYSIPNSTEYFEIKVEKKQIFISRKKL